jgi:hypothetical protein
MVGAVASPPTASRVALYVLLVVALGLQGRARAEPCAEQVTCSEEAHPAPRITDPPHRAIWLAKDGGSRSFLVPALEIPVINSIIWGFDRLVGKPYAHINLYTMGRNLKGPWIWDNDAFTANTFGHPYHGSLFFTAARSSGLNFWQSIPYSLVGSLTWELFFENEQPSKNDLITTTLGGIMLGEILHRTSLLLLDDGHPTILRWLGGFVLDPAGSLNRLFFGRKANDFYPHAPQFLLLGIGVNTPLQSYTSLGGVRTNVDANPQAQFLLDIQYGIPGDRDWPMRKPFDYFELHARAGVGKQTYASLFMTGLLAGADYRTGRLGGVWGLYGGFDYSNFNTLRVQTANIGFGSSAQVELTDKVVLRPSAIVSGIAFGSGGSVQPAIGDRDYHYGPGGQGVLDLQVVHRDYGRLGGSVRAYAISGSMVGEGWENIQYYSAYAEAAVFRNTGLGVEWFLGTRHSQNNGAIPDSFQRAMQLRIYWTLLSDGGYRALVQTSRD